MKMEKNQIFFKIKNEGKNGKFEGIAFALVFHWWFNKNRNIFYHMWEKANFQISMFCLDMLAIYLENQMLNIRIPIKYPPHLDVFMFQL